MSSKYHTKKDGKKAKKGLWYNIHQKRKRIAAGSGEKMRKPGTAGAPSKKALEISKAYNGKFIQHDSAGIQLSNPSSANYYKELLK